MIDRFMMWNLIHCTWSPKGFDYVQSFFIQKYASTNVFISSVGGILLLVDIILRSISQVYFINNPLVGIVMIISIGLTSWKLAGTMILCITCALLSSIILSISITHRIRLYSKDLFDGLLGFDAALVGLAIPSVYQFQTESDEILFICFAGIVCGIMRNGVNFFFSRHLNLPAFTLCFNLTHLGLYQAARYNLFPILSLKSSSSLPDENSISPSNAIMTGSLRSIGQIDFLDVSESSAVMYLALFLGHPLHPVFGWLGALVASSVALGAFQTSKTTVWLGLGGYNAALFSVGMSCLSSSDPISLFLLPLMGQRSNIANEKQGEKTKDNPQWIFWIAATLLGSAVMPLVEGLVKGWLNGGTIGTLPFVLSGMAVEMTRRLIMEAERDSKREEERKKTEMENIHITNDDYLI